jgi:hypothetical protein
MSEIFSKTEGRPDFLQTHDLHHVEELRVKLVESIDKLAKRHGSGFSPPPST